MIYSKSENFSFSCWVAFKINMLFGVHQRKKTLGIFLFFWNQVWRFRGMITRIFCEKCGIFYLFFGGFRGIFYWELFLIRVRFSGTLQSPPISWISWIQLQSVIPKLYIAKIVKIFLSKLSKFSFPNYQNFPFQTVKSFLFQTLWKLVGVSRLKQSPPIPEFNCRNSSTLLHLTTFLS